MFNILLQSQRIQNKKTQGQKQTNKKLHIAFSQSWFKPKQGHYAQKQSALRWFCTSLKLLSMQKFQQGHHLIFIQRSWSLDKFRFLQSRENKWQQLPIYHGYFFNIEIQKITQFFNPIKKPLFKQQTLLMVFFLFWIFFKPIF